MNLIVFDIDGTLTRTVEVDAACYALAFHDVFDIEDLDTDWSRYRESTDTGIAAEILERHLEGPATVDELGRVRSRFVELIQLAYGENPGQFSPIPGAATALDHLRQSPDWAVALATGGWEPTARFKLRAAGLNTREIPAAFADDDPARHRIIATATARAAIHHHRNAFTRMVYVGDAVWDFRAAATLGIPFIGIGEHDRAAKLRHAGATIILPHLEPLDRLIEAMAQAMST